MYEVLKLAGLSFSSLVSLGRRRAFENPLTSIYSFLDENGDESGSLTGGELDRLARAIGGLLQELGAREERVLLLYPQGLDFIAAFLGCLYAGAVAVPAYPPQGRRGLPRLLAIASDAQPKVILTVNSLLPRVQALLQQTGMLAGVRVLATDALPPGAEDGWQDPVAQDDTLAFLQYTSGSTSAPKGVMVTHGNLLHNEETIRRAFGQSEQSIVVSWLPLYHDMGLIGGALQPLYVGGRCVLLSPLTFLQKPQRWLEAISRYRATTSGGPNFAYDLCVRKIGMEERTGLDLSSWQVAFNGSEPVRSETLDSFARAFASCGFERRAFYPCYGLAEATLFVSGGAAEEEPVCLPVLASGLRSNQVADAAGEDRQVLVGCGRPWLDHQLLVVDPETGRICAPDEVGEIWFAGPSRTRGYWNRPEDTGRTFRVRPAGDTGEPCWLRTGDLGFLCAGELFVTGRLKDLIIVRGRNYYPQDIELTAEKAHPALRPGCGAAFSVEVGGEERLVVVYETSHLSGTAADEAAEAVRRAVADEHEVTVHDVLLLRAGLVSKTSSGKVRRQSCRADYLRGELVALGRSRAGETTVAAGAIDDELPDVRSLASSARQPALELHLRREVAAISRLPLAAVAAEQSLTALGVDSLGSVELRQRLEATWNVPIPLELLLHSPSLSALAASLVERLDEPSREVGPRPGASAAESCLSHGQLGLWFLDRLQVGSPVYNIAAAARVSPPLDSTALRCACRMLSARHPGLRTTFNPTEGAPIQRVHADMSIELLVEDANDWSEERLRARLDEEAQRPFDLDTGPPARAALFERDSESVVLITVHHIVSDFWSMVLIGRELGALYIQETGGPEAGLPPLVFTYADFVGWQREQLAGASGERLRAFWLDRLAGLPPELDLPTDRPRPPVQTSRGAAVDTFLGKTATVAMRGVARSRESTLFVALLAAFQALLHRYTSLTDLAVGTPTAGRNAPEWSGVVGYFVNPIVLRGDLSGEPTFAELLERTRRTAVEAFAHQDYPFTLLAEALQPERDASRSPLFQTMLVLHVPRQPREDGLMAFALRQAGPQVELGGLALEPLLLPERTSAFDLTLRVSLLDAGLAVSLQYNTDLFDPVTARRLTEHFRRLAEGAATQPDLRISELPLLADSERHQLLHEWSDSGMVFPRDLCLHELIEAQVRRTPEAVAVVFEGAPVAYRELNHRADRLARSLWSRGVGPEVRVAVLLERSPLLPVALLAVLKAGGAYVPLDPAYPPSRLALMIEDSRAAVLLSQMSLGQRCDELGHGRPVVIADTADAQPVAEGRPGGPVALPENLAYVIYTSGSTGRPKGVAVSHRNLVNFLVSIRRWPGMTAADRLLAVTSLSFDIAGLELFLPLVVGASLELASTDQARDPARLRERLESGEITAMQATPVTWRMLLEAGWSGDGTSRRIAGICGGEALPSDLAGRLGRAATPLWNVYGPTETTVWSTVHRVEGQDERGTVSIGRAIANTSIHVLDRRQKQVPVGVPGELYIGGAGVARGYLERPDLTADRFVPDPFADEGGQRLYRTGDRACRLSTGEVEFLGRLDHQVKVRGFRIELGEIESALVAHPQVGQVIVMVRPVAEDDPRVVSYIVPSPDGVPTVEELRVYLGAILPEYMVPSFFVFLSALPLTPNGKVDRKALPEPAAERETAREAPLDPIEEALAEIWAEVLGVPVIGPDDDFFKLGGHSLLATRMLSRVRAIFRVKLAVSSVFQATTVARLARKIEAALAEAAPAVPAGAAAQESAAAPATGGETISSRFGSGEGDHGEWPLSYAQQRLWFIEQLESGSPFYNGCTAMRLTGGLTVPVLAAVLEEIVRRHEVLRTVFALRSGQPVQVVGPARPKVLPVVDLQGLPQAAMVRESQRLVSDEAWAPFDLTRGPLLRCKLLRLAPREHVMALTLHHIVADGWSREVFAKEVGELYQAFSRHRPSPLPELPIQYADFAVWQHRWLQGEALEADLSYWRRQLAGAPALLALRTDYPRPAVQTFRGGSVAIDLSTDSYTRLKDLSSREGVSLFMTLLAVYQTLLHHYSSQDDVVVGAPISYRNWTETEGLIGFFANTLAFRTDFSGDPSFSELLARVREMAVDAYAHQNLPFEKVVEELRPERALSHNPLFQVTFSFETPQVAPLLDAGLTLMPFEFDMELSQFDLNLRLLASEEGLRGALEFKRSLFEDGTVRWLLEQLLFLLDKVERSPEIRISELRRLLAAADEKRLGTLGRQLREMNSSRLEQARRKAIAVNGLRVGIGS